MTPMIPVHRMLNGSVVKGRTPSAAVWIPLFTRLTSRGGTANLTDKDLRDVVAAFFGAEHYAGWGTVGDDVLRRDRAERDEILARWMNSAADALRVLAKNLNDQAAASFAGRIMGGA